jgi:hypothetical protein
VKKRIREARRYRVKKEQGVWHRYPVLGPEEHGNSNRLDIADGVHECRLGRGPEQVLESGTIRHATADLSEGDDEFGNHVVAICF